MVQTEVTEPSVLDLNSQHDNSPREQLTDQAIWFKAIPLASSLRKEVRLYARKFMPFSPYPLEDYEAYSQLAAYEAVRDWHKNQGFIARGCVSDRRETGEKKVTVEQYFWVKIKHIFSRISTNPAQQDVVPQIFTQPTKEKPRFYTRPQEADPDGREEDISQEPERRGESVDVNEAGRGACIFSSYVEEYEEEQERKPTGAANKSTALSAMLGAENERAFFTRRMIGAALKKMSQPEKEVWEELLQGHSVQYIAEERQCTRHNVEKLRDRGLKRIMRIFSQGALPDVDDKQLPSLVEKMAVVRRVK